MPFSKFAGLLDEVRLREEELASLRGDARFAREEKEQGESEHAVMRAESRSLERLVAERRLRGWRRRGRRPRDA